jgi:hypothetical protein
MEVASEGSAAAEQAPTFATDGFAEVQPYYGPLDELEVGSIWRLEKLKDFEWKVCPSSSDATPRPGSRLHTPVVYDVSWEHTHYTTRLFGSR